MNIKISKLMYSVKLIVFFLSFISGYSYTTNFIDVPIDHFNGGNKETFKLKYLMNNENWDSKEGSILLCIGDKKPIESFVNNTGFLFDISEEFKALVVFAEHRYYGESMPFGDKSYENDNLVYLTEKQVLADFVDLIKLLHENNTAQPNPVFTFGDWYGGMLSAWIREKYPTYVEGAIASSAPIMLYEGKTPCDDFSKKVTSIFRNANPECAKTISSSWTAIDHVAATESGKEWLSTNWKLCRPLHTDDDVINLKTWLSTSYEDLAENNYPYDTGAPSAFLPANPVNKMCMSMTNSTVDQKTILTSVFQGINACFNHNGSAKCLDIDPDPTDRSYDGWLYQCCNGFLTADCVKDCDDDNMFEPHPWDFKSFADFCKSKYGFEPDLSFIEKTYGGKNLESASNIIFSYGTLDPWSVGGLKKSISSTVVVLWIEGAAHSLDLMAANPNDPPSVTTARNTIKESIQKWLDDYRSRKS